MRTVEYIEFTPEMRVFLKNYSPKEKGFTSSEEVRLVENNLNIEEYKDNLTALRNSVVRFYSELIGTGSDRDRTSALMESMMSVTAVIDNYAYKF